MKTPTCNCMEGYDCPVCFDQPKTMKENMKTQAKPVPHIHAEIIKAWADGAEIEVRRGSEYKWNSVHDPRWESDYEFRVKPEPKPDVVYFMTLGEPSYGAIQGSARTLHHPSLDSLKLTFDGETGKLKKAEVL